MINFNCYLKPDKDEIFEIAFIVQKSFKEIKSFQEIDILSRIGNEESEFEKVC